MRALISRIEYPLLEKILTIQKPSDRFPDGAVEKIGSKTVIALFAWLLRINARRTWAGRQLRSCSTWEFTLQPTLISCFLLPNL
jgi:hypothetical protein